MTVATLNDNGVQKLVQETIRQVLAAKRTLTDEDGVSILPKFDIQFSIPVALEVNAIERRQENDGEQVQETTEAPHESTTESKGQQTSKGTQNSKGESSQHDVGSSTSDGEESSSSKDTDTSKSTSATESSSESNGGSKSEQKSTNKSTLSRGSSQVVDTSYTS